ncbi:hypothetical protein PHIN7_03890 [Polynucleobacter sp. HIN7]|nr:hypothetical protein PHIN7_03890 [Polynucleobacter sp. HIN7]
MAVNFGAAFTDLALGLAVFAVGFAVLETTFLAGAFIALPAGLLTFFTGTLAGFLATAFTDFFAGAAGFTFLTGALALGAGFANFLGATLEAGFFMDICAIDQSNKLVNTHLIHIS